MDPDSLNPDTDPAFQVNLDLAPDPGFDDQKYLNLYNFIFVGHFCPPGYGSREPFESGSHQDPDIDPQHWLKCMVL